MVRIYVNRWTPARNTIRNSRLAPLSGKCGQAMIEYAFRLNYHNRTNRTKAIATSKNNTNFLLQSVLFDFFLQCFLNVKSPIGNTTSAGTNH